MRHTSSLLLTPCLLSASLLGGAALYQRAAVAHESPKRPVVEVPQGIRDKTTVCTDGKSHYVAVTPNDSENKRYTVTYYGDGKQFFEVPAYLHLTRTLFRDPRHYNTRVSGPDHGWGRRDEDKRLWSGVMLEEGKCKLWCGEHDIPMTLVAPDKAQAMLRAATFAASPRKWMHHALARDDSGTYYYVDHGFYEDGAKTFRLFVGHKGALKAVPITEVISDTAGDVIVTKTGSLALNQGGAVWKGPAVPTPLVRMDLDEKREDGAKNILLVYNDLGVYKGERLGTPCDNL